MDGVSIKRVYKATSSSDDDFSFVDNEDKSFIAELIEQSESETADRNEAFEQINGAEDMSVEDIRESNEPEVNNEQVSETDLPDYSSVLDESSDEERMDETLDLLETDKSTESYEAEECSMPSGLELETNQVVDRSVVVPYSDAWWDGLAKLRETAKKSTDLEETLEKYLCSHSPFPHRRVFCVLTKFRCIILFTAEFYCEYVISNNIHF